MRSLLLHPHPDHGGDQHNNVIAALFAQLDQPVRFDFHSSDLAACTAQVLTQLESGPAWLVGYSFGGAVASLLDDPRVVGWFLIAPAVTMVDPVIGPDKRPKHVLTGARDAFFGAATLRQATADWTFTTYDVVEGADHFFAGHEADVATRCRGWIAGAAQPPS